MSAIGSVLLDTSVVIEYLRKADPALIEKMDRASEVYVPLVVLGELCYGVYRSTNRTRTLDSVRTFMRASTLVRPTEMTADLYGQVKAGLASQGTPIPQNDIWIAASALEQGLPLATRDAHFEKIKNLVVLRW